MGAEIFKEYVTAEVVPGDPFTVEFLSGQGAGGSTLDQGIIYSSLHRPWGIGDGAAGDGAQLHTDIKEADRLSFLQTLGSGTSQLDSDVSGASAAGIGFGLWDPMTHSLTVRGRGQWISELAPSKSTLVRALLAGASGQDGRGEAFRLSFEDFFISSKLMTASIELFSIEGASGVSIKNCAADGRSRLPNDQSFPGNFNPETGVRHFGTPVRVRGASKDIDVIGFYSLFAGAHGLQSSPAGSMVESRPQQIRFRGCVVKNSHSSGCNISGSRDFVLSQYFFRNDVRAHGGYYSGYGGVRIGNGCTFLQLDGLWIEGAFRNVRWVDIQYYLAMNIFSKNAGLTGAIFNGKDTLNTDGSIIGLKCVNANRNAGHGGILDDSEDEPEQTAPSNYNIFMLTDGNPDLNGHRFQWSDLSTVDDMIDFGLGGIVTVAGSKTFWIIDNWKCGGDFAGGASARILWLIKEATTGVIATTSEFTSVLYSNAHMQTAALLGHAYKIKSFQRYTGQNGTGSPTENVGATLSSVCVCEFDTACAISIGSSADFSTAQPYRIRNPLFDPRYFAIGGGSISTTLNQTAIAGTGSDFTLEMQPALALSRIMLWANNANRDFLGELASITNPSTAAFIASGARSTYSGGFLWTIEQKITKSFVLAKGPKDHVFNFQSMQFNGYGQCPADIHPLALKKFNFPRSEPIWIGPQTISTAGGVDFYVPLPRDLLDWRAMGIAYLDIQPWGNIAGDAANYLKLRVRKLRNGVVTTLATELELTRLAVTAPNPISVPRGINGPFDYTVVANLFRVGSPQHSEVPDLVMFNIYAVGTGGAWPGGFAYFGWIPTWKTGA